MLPRYEHTIGMSNFIQKLSVIAKILPENLRGKIFTAHCRPVLSYRTNAD